MAAAPLAVDAKDQNMQISGAPTTVDSNEEMQNGTALSIDTGAQMRNTLAVEPSALSQNGAVDIGSHAQTAAKPEDRLACRSLAAPLALGFVAVLYAVLTPLALWLYADRPLAAVWVFSIIVCSYVFPWIVLLTVTMRTCDVFASISCLALAAAAVAPLSPYTGVFIALIDMAYATGLFGYALAEHRQHDGTEQCVAAMHTRSYQSKEELKRNRVAALYATVTSLAGAALGIWVALDADCLIIETLSIILGISLEFWLAAVTMDMPYGFFIVVTHMPLVFLFSGLLSLPELVVEFLFGKGVGALVYPLGIMYLAGLLGYNLLGYTQTLAEPMIKPYKLGVDFGRRQDETKCIALEPHKPDVAHYQDETECVVLDEIVCS